MPQTPSGEERPAARGAYPIRVVSRLSGLSPHTLRIWEQRYGAVRPRRTAGNQRLYGEDDIARIRLLRDAVEAGNRIGEVAGLDNAALARLARPGPSAEDAGRSDSSPHSESLRVVEAYLEDVRRYRVQQAADRLHRAAVLLPAAAFREEVLLPILRRTGDDWEAGRLRVAQEHIISTHVRAILDTLTRLRAPLPGAPSVVMATPAGHRHELGLLIAALCALERGVEPVYLGPDVPLGDLLPAALAAGSNVVLLSIIYDPGPGARAALHRQLRRIAESITLWIGLPHDHPSRGKVPSAREFTDFEALEAALTRLALGSTAT